MDASYAAFVEVHLHQGVARVDVLNHLAELHPSVEPERPAAAKAATAAPPGAAQLADLSKWNQAS